MNDSPVSLVRHEDVIQPFMLHNSIMRGRMVRLDHTLNAILARHAYDDHVSKQLGELLVIAAMLSSNLSKGGILTLQIKGNGPIPFMVADAEHLGNIRAYATVNDDALAALGNIDDLTLPDLFGTGYLAITLDMPGGEPYQGIVPLEGDSLQQAVQHYFSQSQQLDVMFHIHVSKRVRDGGDERWVAAGIMMERMPDIAHNETAATADEISNARDWDYQSLVVRTATQAELSDPHLAPQALLYRLFNENGVWVYEAQAVHDACRCSRERVSNTLASLPRDELAEMSDDGSIIVTCQFCSREESFMLDDIDSAR